MEEDRWTWRVLIVVLIAGLAVVAQSYFRGAFWPTHREALRGLLTGIMRGL